MILKTTLDLLTQIIRFLSKLHMAMPKTLSSFKDNRSGHQSNKSLKTKKISMSFLMILQRMSLSNTFRNSLLLLTILEDLTSVLSWELRLCKSKTRYKKDKIKLSQNSSSRKKFLKISIIFMSNSKFLRIVPTRTSIQYLALKLT
jgi:hypothetical protein